MMFVFIDNKVNKGVKTMKTLSREDQIWDYLIENCIVSEETLKIVTSINGYNEKTFNDVIYAVTGYRSLEQLIDVRDVCGRNGK